MDAIIEFTLRIILISSNCLLRYHEKARSGYRRCFLRALAVVIPVILLSFVYTATLAAPAAETRSSPLPLDPLALKFDHLSMEQGLSEATVMGIAQDQLGFMWFATQNGLNKFDGQRFTVYTHNPDDDNSLNMNNVRTLFVDSRGDLWIGTYSGGLDHMARDTEVFSHYVHDPQDPNSLSDNYVRAVVEDPAGYLWIGTQNGLNRFDPATGSFIRYLHDPDDPNSLSHNTVYGLTMDGEGNLWVGTPAGACRFQVLTERFTCYRHDPADDASISDNVVFAILADSTGTIWFGTTKGLNAFNPVTERAIRYAYDPENPDSIGGDIIFRLYEDSQQRLWIGTQGGGLSYLDRSTGRFTVYRANADIPNNISGDIISSIYEDRSGILWVGTVANGVSFAASSRHKFSPLLYIDTPLAIEGDNQGRLWVGSLENGLLAYTADGVTTYRHDARDPDSLRANIVFALDLDDANQLWIGTGRGLNRLDTLTGRIDAPFAEQSAAVGLDETTVRAVIYDRRGWLWIGTQTRLYCLDMLTQQFDCYQPDPANALEANLRDIRAMHVDEAGIVWLGTTNGLFSYHPEAPDSESRLRQYVNMRNDPRSLSEDFVSVIQSGADGTLWIGTWGGGINHFDPASSVFTRYGEREGLPNELVLSILADARQQLWIGTANGLARFDPGTTTFRTYDRLDGLPHNNFVQNAMFKDEQGRLYLGASNAVVAFNPDDIQDNPYLPPVMLTGFQVFNQSMPVGGESPLQQHPNYVREITLPYNQSVFTFEFVGLNFSAAAKNHYAYRMERVDPDWNYVGDRRLATYTNLSPGEYIFRVIASNNDGVWNEDGLSLRLVITPPWWQTWWAYLLYGMAATAAVTGIVMARTRTQTRQLEEQRRELARERQLREMVERADASKDMERARIAREIHDGVSQTLAGLQFRVSTWKVFRTQELARMEAEFDEVSGALHDTLQELRRVIFGLRPVVLEDEGLADAVILLADNLSQYYEVPIRAQVVVDGQAIPAEVEHTLFRMIQELLNNAGRHARAHTITLQLRATPAQIELEVCDDGVGFDSSLQAPTANGHWGLLHLRERVALLKGTLKIDSAPGQGTRVNIRVPLGG